MGAKRSNIERWRQTWKEKCATTLNWYLSLISKHSTNSKGFQRYLVFSLRFEIQIWLSCFYGIIISSYGFVEGCQRQTPINFTYPINQKLAKSYPLLKIRKQWGHWGHLGQTGPRNHSSSAWEAQSQSPDVSEDSPLQFSPIDSQLAQISYWGQSPQPEHKCEF